MLALFGQYPTS